MSMTHIVYLYSTNTLRKVLVCYMWTMYLLDDLHKQHYEADFRHGVAFRGAKGCKVSSTI